MRMKCERERCRKEAEPGSRWCKGHAYVGENYQAPGEEEEVRKTTPHEKRSIADTLKRMFGWKEA